MPPRRRKGGATHGVPSEEDAAHTERPQARREQAELPDVRRGDVWAVLCSAAAFAVYFATSTDSVSGGDSGELMSVAKEFGVAHPPGYPLWVTLSYALEAAGVGMHLLSPACGAVAAGAAFLCVHLVTGSIGAGCFGAGVLTVTPSFWRYSTTPEVFALNNALCAVLLYYGLRYVALPARRPTTLLCCALVSSFALANQHTSVVFIAPSGAAILFHFAFLADGFDTEKIVVLGLCAVVFVSSFLLIYSQLLWASYHSNSKHSWGAVFDIPGFITHVLRTEYGTFSLANQKASYAKTDFYGTLSDWMAYCTRQAGSTPLLVLAGVGLAFPLPAQGTRPVLTAQALLLLNLGCYLYFFATLANLPKETALFRSVLERFWMQPFIVVALGCGMGYARVVSAAQWVLAELQRAWQGKAQAQAKPQPAGWLQGALRGAVAAAAMAHVCHTAVLRWDSQNQRGNRVVETFGYTLLDPLQKDSILLTKGDILTNSVRYVQTFHGYRTDVKALDVEMMASEWYIPRVRHFYPDVTFPGTSYSPKGGFNSRQFLEENIVKRGHAVYVAYDLGSGDNTWKKLFERVPIGVADMFVLKETLQRFDSKTITRVIDATERGMSPEMDAVVLGSNAEPWDDVCVGDYWASLFRMGHFLAQRADVITSAGASVTKKRKADAARLRDQASVLLDHVLQNGANGTKPYVRALAGKVYSMVLVTRIMALPQTPDAAPKRVPLIEQARHALQTFITLADGFPDKFPAKEVSQYRSQLKAFDQLVKKSG